mgnify:CR=1 FL=1
MSAASNRVHPARPVSGSKPSASMATGASLIAAWAFVRPAAWE